MKKILFFLLGIMLMHCADGQTNVIATEPNVHANTNSTLISEYKYPSTVTCVNSDDSTATFIYSNQTMQTMEASVSGIHVNDMLIYRDTVIFCGRMADGSKMGIIGYLSVPDLISGTANVYILNGFLAGENWKVTDLKRLIMKPTEQYEWHIVCIGRCNILDPHDCIVETYVQNPDPMSLWSFKGGVPSDENESFTDIKAVGNYAVTSGFEESYGHYLNLRLYDPFNIFSTSGIQDMQHIFCIDTAFVDPWTGDEVLLAPVTDNIFATASHYKHVSLTRKDVHLALYDLGSMLGGSVYSLFYTLYIDFASQKNFSERLDRFIYSPAKKSLVFLRTSVQLLSGLPESVFCEISLSPLTWNFTAVYPYTNTSNLLQGLSLYNYENKYVMSGFDKWNASTLRYHMESFGVPPLCSEEVMHLSVKPKNFASVNKSVGFTVSSGKVSSVTYEPGFVAVPLTVICGDL